VYVQLRIPVARKVVGEGGRDHVAGLHR
jgi:hypothetical protein